jgi:hypothetical protein
MDEAQVLQKAIRMMSEYRVDLQNKNYSEIHAKTLQLQELRSELTQFGGCKKLIQTLDLILQLGQMLHETFN